MAVVRIQASKAYDVRIGPGLLGQAGSLTAQVVKPCKAMLVSDQRVAGLYGSQVRQAYEYAGYDLESFICPAGEGSKSLQTLGALLEQMAQAQMSRSDVVLALGGGVIGDLAGFAASVYARGIPFVQIPTTLLAAVDSSVGGKTAVNLEAGKNLAGSFWQPSLVLCDTQVMADLPENLLREGAAEIIKTGIIGAPALFETMEAGKLLDKLEEIIEACVAFKGRIVAADERDTGSRQLLNLGHTLGHGAEACSGYTLPHGLGVAMGLALIARASERLFGGTMGLQERICKALRVNGLPVECPYSVEALCQAALVDKKRQGGQITWVMPKDIGQCDLLTLPIERLSEIVAAGKGERP